MIYSILTKIKIIAAAAIYIESGDLNPKAFFLYILLFLLVVNAELYMLVCGFHK